MVFDEPEAIPRSSVVNTPGLRHLWMCLKKLPNDREDSYPVLYYLQGVPLGQYLFSMEEVIYTTWIPNH